MKNNDEKLITIFFNMHCDVHYNPAKFEIKNTTCVWIKQKRQIVLCGKIKWHGLAGKLNQVIVYRITQTLVILGGTKLNFFQKNTKERMHEK